MPVSASIGQRFAQLIKHLGMSKNAFAQSLGKTATVIQHLVDERNKPGYDLLCKVFEVYPNVSKDWLLLGQGPMLLASPATGAATGAGKDLGLSAPQAGVGNGGALAAQAALPLSPPPGLAAEGVAATPPAPPVASTPLALTAALAAAPIGEEQAKPAAAAAPTTPEAPLPTPRPAAEANTAPAPAEAYLTAALHAQHLQHQLALADQRNQHLLEQQRLMQQMLDLAQRR